MLKFEVAYTNWKKNIMHLTGTYKCKWKMEENIHIFREKDKQIEIMSKKKALQGNIDIPFKDSTHEVGREWGGQNKNSKRVKSIQ